MNKTKDAVEHRHRVESHAKPTFPAISFRTGKTYWIVSMIPGSANTS